MKTKKKSALRRTAPHKTATTASDRQPFIAHAHELRRRLYFVAASIFVWGAAAYAVEHSIVAVLLRPAKGQHFIYTTPGGGVDFLFRICLYTGVVFSLPVIVYNALRFVQPLISDSSRRFIALSSALCGGLAVAGILFGYYLGLPAALHFLLHQFRTVQIQPLVTIQSYLGFVLVYMAGSAMLFQLPLLLIFINRIKPLSPKRLLHYERWVILVAFIVAALMNPSPNILSQLLVAGPFILMYQIGIVVIMLINRRPRQVVLTPEVIAAEPFPEPLLEAQVQTSTPVPHPRPRAAATSRIIDPMLRPPIKIAAPRPVHQSTALPRLRSRQEMYAIRGQRRPMTGAIHDVTFGFSRPVSMIDSLG